MGMEYELKFQATEQAQAQIYAQVIGQEMRYQMRTTYYDTAQGALSQRHYTLRRRMENGVSVCTLKAPAAGHGRGEWEVLCEDMDAAIALLCEQGAPGDLQALTQAGVQEVCGASFERIAKTLTFPDGELELALDRGVLLGGGRELPLCEVEVELKSGAPALAERYAKVLAQKYGLVPEKKSKFRRALMLSKGEL